MFYVAFMDTHLKEKMKFTKKGDKKYFVVFIDAHNDKLRENH